MTTLTKTDPVLAQSIEPTSEGLIITLHNKERFKISWEHCSPRLAAAKPEQRLHAELSPGGYGIHWPLIDEDLSVRGLIQRGEESAKSP